MCESDKDIARARRLPHGVPPVLQCWFWNAADGEPERFEPFLDTVARHSACNILTTSMRIGDRHFTDPAVREAARVAAAFGRRRGVGIALELPFWASYPAAYPEETLDQVRVCVAPLNAGGATVLRVEYETGNVFLQQWPFRIGPARLERLFEYEPCDAGIRRGSLRDRIGEAAVREDAEGCFEVEVPPVAGGTSHRSICAVVRIPWQFPDPFGAHLFEHHRGLIGDYARVDLAGVCLDEWGLPAFAKDNEYWSSPAWEATYAERAGGRDLVSDLVLMHLGEEGRECERLAANNHYMEMTWQRLAEVEENFYRAVKDVFGPDAFVGTHPTWQPHLSALEVRRNGWNWWAVRRDFAQTDEVTPFPVRTALAKKWGSGVWYNMYYSTRLEDYECELWTSVLAGGRVNYHPVFPASHPRGWDREALLRGDLMRADCRVRLLNLITNAPVDCPVAVIFGHVAALNQAGQVYADSGVELAEDFWRAGYYADLFPTSEIASGALHVDGEGRIRCGAQTYRAIVLYQPEFERPATARFFQEAARGGKTFLARIGAWTRDFEARPFDGATALPKAMRMYENREVCIREAQSALKLLGEQPHSPGSPRPPRRGRSRLTDGTVVLTAAEERLSGDPIKGRYEFDGTGVMLDAEGVAAFRLDAQGAVEAVAAGGLLAFAGPGLCICLERRTDLALWREEGGKWRGALQGHAGPVPESLRGLTEQWMRLDVPERLP